MKQQLTAESFGRDTLGPVVAEFCLRLWALSSLFAHPENTVLLFCARGGLRLQLAYERFLAATGLDSPTPVAPLMISRLAAIRPALVRSMEQGSDSLVSAAANALDFEFGNASVSGVALSVSGITPPSTGRWDAPYRATELAALLKHPDGEEIAGALTEQAHLFTRHLRSTLGGRRHAVLVDTGLYGTTRALVADAFPDLQISSALMVRSVRGATIPQDARTVGLSVEAHDYAPWSPRTALLRYWHFVEWLFEPDLPSVRSFNDVDGVPRANLEVDDWQQRVSAEPGTPFAGVLAYLDNLTGGSRQVVQDADRAWPSLHRAIVRPDRSHAEVLRIGTRSHDFGRADTWDPRSDPGALAALRGSTMWREGEIARSGSPLSRPLLTLLDCAYGARYVQRALTRRVSASREYRWSPSGAP